MVFFIDEARSPPFLTNVNKKMVFFIEGFPYLEFQIKNEGFCHLSLLLKMCIKLINTINFTFPIRTHLWR